VIGGGALPKSGGAKKERKDRQKRLRSPMADGVCRKRLSEKKKSNSEGKGEKNGDARSSGLKLNQSSRARTFLELEVRWQSGRGKWSLRAEQKGKAEQERGAGKPNFRPENRMEKALFFLGRWHGTISMLLWEGFSASHPR